MCMLMLTTVIVILIFDWKLIVIFIFDWNELLMKCINIRIRVLIKVKQTDSSWPSLFVEICQHYEELNKYSKFYYTEYYWLCCHNMLKWLWARGNARQKPSLRKVWNIALDLSHFVSRLPNISFREESGARYFEEI